MDDSKNHWRTLIFIIVSRLLSVLLSGCKWDIDTNDNIGVIMALAIVMREVLVSGILNIFHDTAVTTLKLGIIAGQHQQNKVNECKDIRER